MRRFDPVNPNLRQMMQAQMYGLANQKCKDFAAVISRVALIDRMANDQAEQCGNRPSDDTLADIFFPSLDGSCLTELVHYRVDVIDKRTQLTVPRPVNSSSYIELREYVQKRQAREKSMIPIPEAHLQQGIHRTVTTCTETAYTDPSI